MEDKSFIKVSAKLVRELGSDEAILYAFLTFVLKYRKVDSDGFAPVETSYIGQNLGWSDRRIIRHRNKLIEVGLLRFKQGVNQNIKNRYKMT